MNGSRVNIRNDHSMIGWRSMCVATDVQWRQTRAAPEAIGISRRSFCVTRHTDAVVTTIRHGPLTENARCDDRPITNGTNDGYPCCYRPGSVVTTETRSPRRVSVDLRSGRCANMLLQIAACAGLAKRRGVNPGVPADWPYRRWFNLPEHWYMDDLTGTVPAHTLAHQLPPPMRPYLQSLVLWSNVVPEIRKAFRPSPEAETILCEAWSQFDGLERPLFPVHVRRGDTITRNPPGTIQPLPATYFVDAIDRLKSDGPGTVVVFSDDPEWCTSDLSSGWHVVKGEPGPEDFESDYWVRERRDWIDLFLMAMCAAEDRDQGGIVISNSTFGWVSAWMADIPRVCYPSRWFGPRLLRQGFDIGLLLPLGWTEIETV